MIDPMIDRFHGIKNTEGTGDSFNDHFWRGYRSFGWALQHGCGCGYCERGWTVAREAFTLVAKRYYKADLEARQLDLLK